jgi:hypothetical protein
MRPHRTLPESVRRLATASPASRGAGHHFRQAKDPAENERLTALAGFFLFLLLALEGVTLLFLRTLLSVHIVVGLLLVPPVLLKLAATGWRFLHYYLGEAEYVRRGPPRLLLRALAPLLVISTIAVLGTGVALVVVGPHHFGPLLLLHKVSFVLWAPAFGVHVLAYVWRVPRLALAAARFQKIAVTGLVAASALGALMAFDMGHLPAAGWFHADFNRDGDRF